MSRIQNASGLVLLLSISIPGAKGQPNAAVTACALEGPNNCQLYDGSLQRTISDRGTYMMVADDFIPSSDTLASLCVWGQYIDNDTDAMQVDCSAESAPDAFRVQIFLNEGNWPGTFYAQSDATSVRTPANFNRNTTGAAQAFLFELTLQSSISLLEAPGTSFWISVTNNSESAAKPQCHWHWSQLSPGSGMGNRYAVKGLEYAIGPGSEHAADYAFCTNFDIAPDGSGTIVHPCCACDGTCAVTTLAECDQSGGRWSVQEASCGEISCSAGPPANDSCAGMLDITDIGGIPFSTLCATTDGPGSVNTELGPTMVGNDIWLSYDNEFGCFLYFDTCVSNFDNVIAVYHDPGNPNHCPCPGDGNFDSVLISASDEGCAGGAAVGGGGGVDGFGFCADERGCYTIRIVGFEGATGTGYLSVSCGVPAFAPPSVTVDPFASPRIRFLSLSVPSIGPCDENLGGQLAIRVILTSLHHVAPPYSGGPSIPFTAFEGQVRWVGSPVQYVESTSSQVPLKAASLQCQPHYRDWSTVGLVHVTGSAVVPSSTYRIETVAASCQGVESSPACQSGGGAVSNPVLIKTARWGDVEVPYDPPSGTTQPNLGDVAALVNKFKNVPGAPIKARALMVGGDAFGNITHTILSVDFGYSHIAACVDAFKGLPYPHTVAACP